jgi:hypothetical protein
VDCASSAGHGSPAPGLPSCSEALRIRTFSTVSWSRADTSSNSASPWSLFNGSAARACSARYYFWMVRSHTWTSSDVMGFRGLWENVDMGSFL